MRLWTFAPSPMLSALELVRFYPLHLPLAPYTADHASLSNQSRNLPWAQPSATLALSVTAIDNNEFEITYLNLLYERLDIVQ